ncbi:hypothetical protein LEP1GSC019_0057 [Leptospira interrogans serovar Pyrogenes str. 2006006960]|nr:hypothetical protein LEP1GSC019_0057 [Leptospira interrogans serovar Pyrogenes str. 2006006960]
MNNVELIPNQTIFRKREEAKLILPSYLISLIPSNRKQK